MTVTDGQAWYTNESPHDPYAICTSINISTAIDPGKVFLNMREEGRSFGPHRLLTPDEAREIARELVAIAEFVEARSKADA